MPINTKQCLVDAALALFAEKGYRATTIQEIAAKAGTNVAAINYHFQSKANFYAEVVMAAMEVEKFEVLQVSPVPENAEQLLRDFIYHHIRQTRDKSRGALLTGIRAQEMAEPGPVLDRVLDKLIRPMLGWLQTVLMLLLPADTDKDVIRRYTISVLSQIQMYTLEPPFLRKAFPQLVLDEDEIELISEHIYNGVMAAIEAEHMRHRTERTA